MTLGRWLRERPSAPPQLTSRILEVLSGRLETPSGEAAPVLLDAAERLLGELVARPSAGRESALDLLTVDALATYAFEAASADPESLVPRANDAMTRLGRLITA